ncbi:RNA-binding protein [Pseudothermotoga sp.]|uniref:RNA-binding protein n=1 Tax=Pseudothermotoga sp. TaxID=2033661 RepID=UPI0031F5F268
MPTSDEELVQELMQIEIELDKALEQEDFERMNLLLEQREFLLKSLSTVPEELAESIIQADKTRLEKMNALLEKFKNQALQIRTSQQALKSYSANQRQSNFDERK